MNSHREAMLNNSKVAREKAQKLLDQVKERDKNLDLVKVPAFKGFKYVERKKLAV